MTVIYYTIEGKKKKGVLYHTKENSQRTNIIQETIVYFSNGTKKKVEIIRKNKLGQLFSEVSAN